MANRPSVYDNQFFNAGVPAAGFKLYTYESGTTTPKATYTDQAGTIPNTNPITLDADGMCELWLGSGEYTLALYTGLIGSGGALVNTWDDVEGAAGAGDITTLRADLANASDPSKGAGMGGHNATLNYAVATIGAVLNDVSINVKMFPWLAKCDGTTDDSAALNAAFASGYGSFVLPGTSVILTDVTLPSGKSLIGLPGVGGIKSTGGNFILGGNQTIEHVKFNMNGTAKQVYGEGTDNVTTKHCEFTGSTNNGLLLSVGPRNYKSVHDWFHDNGKAGLYIAGTEADAPFKIIIDHPIAHDNGEGGVVVSGVGEQTSPAQTANYANVVQITSPTCYSNGTGTANSGLEVFYVTNVQITSPICYDNAEHGISLQEVSGFNIATPVCYGNAFGGICMQSGYDPYNPTESGTIMGGTLTGNDAGMLLKEICSNIQIIGTDLQNNTSYAARLVDIGGSGRKSNDITFMGCSGVPSGGSTITNSNSSTNVTAHNGLNHFGTTVQVNAMVNEAVTSSLTISTVGANETYPEMITLATGADTMRCGIAQASDARRLTLRAAAGATINIQHNQGDGVTYAGFLNNSAATVVIANGASVTYVGNGVNFVQMG